MVGRALGGEGGVKWDVGETAADGQHARDGASVGGYSLLGVYEHTLFNGGADDLFLWRSASALLC